MFDLIRKTIEKAFEPCKSCEVLTKQLEIANHERAELLQTIMGLVKPEVVQHPTTVVKPILPTSMSWGIRKKMMEEKDREEFRIRQEKEIEASKLEKELGVDDASQVSQTV